MDIAVFELKCVRIRISTSFCA